MPVVVAIVADLRRRRNEEEVAESHFYTLRCFGLLGKGGRQIKVVRVLLVKIFD